MPIYLIRRDDAKSYAELRRHEVRAASVYKDIHCICPSFGDAYDREIIDRNPFARISIEAIHRGYVKPNVEQMRKLTDLLPEM